MYSLQIFVCFFQHPERINMQNSTLASFCLIEILKDSGFFYLEKTLKNK